MTDEQRAVISGCALAIMNGTLDKDEIHANAEQIYQQTKNSGWAPSDEGLPRKNDFYQTTERTRLGEIIKNVRHYGVRGWQLKWGSGITVIAWQPLPEPYNPDSKED